MKRTLAALAIFAATYAPLAAAWDLDKYYARWFELLGLGWF